MTRSSKKGTAENANWLRFEDKIGEEQVFLHAEKDCVDSAADSWNEAEQRNGIPGAIEMSAVAIGTELLGGKGTGAAGKAGKAARFGDITELEPGKKGAWNKALNGDLKPNHQYKVGNYLYETDDLGRVNRVSGKLDLETRDRNTYQQGKSAKEDGIKDGLSDDDGGHLIASIFDGPGEQINYAPMNSNLNRGAWKAMENKWADALKKDPPQEVSCNVNKY